MALALLDARHKYMAKVIATSFGMAAPAVEEVLASEENLQAAEDFFRADGAPKLLFYRQARDVYTEDDDAAEPDGPAELFMTTGEVERQRGRAVYFLRVKEGAAVTKEGVETELSYGVVGASALSTLQASLSELYLPLLQKVSTGWQRGLGDDSAADFFAAFGKFNDTLGDAVESLQGGFTLKKPDRMFDVDNKAAAFNRAASEAEIVAAFEAVVEEWCKGTEKLLAESDGGRAESEDAGPETELEYWRSRMAKFNSITEQLKGRECKVVLGVLTAAKSRVLKRWKLLDNSITDANNEAKDNVKYLSTLEKYIEPLSSGNPVTILDALPGLLNNIKMMLTIARCAPPRNSRRRNSAARNSSAQFPLTTPSIPSTTGTTTRRSG